MARAAYLGPDIRRPLVLDAALGLFAARGYDGVSMNEVARAAGVSKPVVYACFADKDDLFAALVRREDARFAALVDAALPEAEAAPAPPVREAASPAVPAARQAVAPPTHEAAPPSPEAGPDRAAVRAGLTALLRAVVAAPDSFRVVYLEGERVTRSRASWEARLADLVAARRPGLAPKEAKLLGRLFVAGAELGFRTLLEHEDDWEPDELADALARALT